MNLAKATLGQLLYLARHTKHKNAALIELDKRIPRE